MSVVGLEYKGPFTTFPEALEEFFSRISARVAEGGMSECTLETACWIERKEIKNGMPQKDLPLYFYNARDFAWHIGLLRREGEKTIVRKGTDGPSEGLLARLFEASTFGLGDASAFIEKLPTPQLTKELIDVAGLTAFLEEASKEHTGKDWLERYADKANAEIPVDRGHFLEKLTKAHEAHHGYEAGLRAPEPDHNWAHWYAEHMLS